VGRSKADALILAVVQQAGALSCVALRGVAVVVGMGGNTGAPAPPPNYREKIFEPSDYNVGVTPEVLSAGLTIHPKLALTAGDRHAARYAADAAGSTGSGNSATSGMPSENCG
jgi:hypothetical protein